MPNITDTATFYILDEDKIWARQRIAELEKSIQDLGPEFAVALTQSSETWHDNAPFDALRDTQSLLVAERQTLIEALAKAAITVPKPKGGRVGIGSCVRLQVGAKNRQYLIVGDWSPRVGHQYHSALVISRQSPLGRLLIGMKLGHTLTLPGRPPASGEIIEIT